jgi:ribonuclease HII
MPDRSEPRRTPLAELRRRARSCPAGEEEALLAALRADPRAGASGLAASLERRARSRRQREERGRALLRRERELGREGYLRIAGVDEAGMGPLAGPVVAAAVILEPGAPIEGLDDSKRLTPARRERLEVVLRRSALAWGVAEVSPRELDRLNVYRAGLLAMRRAVEALEPAPDYLLVDARTVPGVATPQEAHVLGDARHHAIAAASVLAKAHRDRLMGELARSYPGYGFERHKGYATASHLEALERLGPTPEHRWSFAPVARVDPAEARRRLRERAPLPSVQADLFEEG